MNQLKFMGVFSSEPGFMDAVNHLKNSNTEIEELYSPVPVHEAVRIVAGRSNMPTVIYFLGIFSMLGTLAFLYYTAVIDWPLNIGGKPSNAFPSFIIVTLVVTIFLVTILSLLIFSIRARLYPGKKVNIIHQRAMDDKFVVVLNPDKVPDAEEKLRQSGAEEIIQYFNNNE